MSDTDDTKRETRIADIRNAIERRLPPNSGVLNQVLADLDTINALRAEVERHEKAMSLVAGSLCAAVTERDQAREALRDLHDYTTGADRKLSYAQVIASAAAALGDQPGDGQPRPEIVCISGSSRFCAETAILAWDLEKAGSIALGMHLLPDAYCAQAHHQAEFENVADAMDALHLRKIDMADRLLVANIGEYIGESTRREIEYAKKLGKPIEYVEPGDGGEGE